MRTCSTAAGRSPHSSPAASAQTNFDQFMTRQRVRGVLVLHDGKVRLERYAPPAQRHDALELLFRGEIDHVHAGRRRA